MMASKEEILAKHTDLQSRKGWVGLRRAVLKAMEEYATESMISLVENISHQEVSVYSMKPRGLEKKYFLGKNYVEMLIKRIKQ